MAFRALVDEWREATWKARQRAAPSGSWSSRHVPADRRPSAAAGAASTTVQNPFRRSQEASPRPIREVVAEHLKAKGYVK